MRNSEISAICRDFLFDNNLISHIFVKIQLKYCQMPPKTRSYSKANTAGKVQVDKKEDKTAKPDIVDSFYNAKCKFLLFMT